MHHSKSLKLINRSIPSTSNQNPPRKTEKFKQVMGRNRKKVKRNSTGNMEMHLEERSLRKHKEKDQKSKTDIFKRIEILKCEPIPQIQTPTLIDKPASYQIPSNLKQDRVNLRQKQTHYHSVPNEPQNYEVLKDPKECSIMLNRKNHTVKRNIDIQSYNNFAISRVETEKQQESFLESLNRYILTIRKRETSETQTYLPENRNTKYFSKKTVEQIKQRQLCKLLESKLRQSQKVIQELRIQNHYQAKRLEKRRQKHGSIKDLILQAHQNIEQLKENLKYEIFQRKRLEMRLKQHESHILHSNQRSRKQISYKQHLFQEELQSSDEEDQDHHLSRFFHQKRNKRRSQDKTQLNQYKQRYTSKRVQELLNYNFDSDISNE